MEYKITTHSEEETMEIAQNLESEKFPGMVICLNGELGSGKTLFVKGFAVGLGIAETITSPTFTIVKEYLDGEAPLYHMDVYRLKDGKDNIGLDDYFDGNGISIIEWADLIEDKLPEERLDINFIVVDENTRILKFVPHGKMYEDLCNSVL
jgi:tRNA threonylcarbamoyladenosine biosynthesis protein TsaE